MSYISFTAEYVSNGLFFVAACCVVYRLDCGLRRNYNVFRIEIDWGGYRSSTLWFEVTCTMSRYGSVLAVYITRNKKR